MSDEPGTLARILFVDDSKLMLKAAQRMLAAEFEVITAVDGVDAWDLLERDDTIQVVFTDLDMPNSDGYELLHKVRTCAEPGLQNMPVIVVTGASDDESARVKSLHLGATDFITKPFVGIDLLARARAHAKYQRMTRQLQAQSTLDALTGLTNRPGFLDRVQQDIAYARRHQQAMTLVRVELDDLRTIFLKRGKAVAEQLVLHVSDLIRTRIRKEDTAARIGLGSFAISLPGGQLQGVESMIDQLRAEVATQPPQVAGEAHDIALSAAVLGAELQHWPNAQDMLDRCQALLAGAPARSVEPAPPSVPSPIRQAQPVPSVIADAESSPPQESTATQQAPSARLPPASTVQPTAATLEPLRLDPLLDQIKQGHTQEAIDKMPQVLQRLAPLLRLLNSNQRTQLIRFMQRMGDA